MPVILITYKRLDVTEIEAEDIIREIFSVSYHAVDAVTALAGGKEMEENIIYHFNGMGSSALISPPEDDYIGGRQRSHQEDMEVVTDPTQYSHPEVLSICLSEHNAGLTWEDGPKGPALTYDPPTGEEWNLRIINANRGIGLGSTGKGVKVAIVDTGIAYHEDLKVKGGVSFCPGDDNFRSDDFGHGTRCAGVVGGRLGGVAKDADLFSVKVANSRGSSPQAILLALNWAHRNRMNVVSISFSGPPDLRYMPLLANAVQALMEVNCVVVASTGDDQSDVGFPAYTPGIIAVGGCTRDAKLLKCTCIGGNGNHITVAAPGADIKTTFHKDNFYVNSFGGSSAAAPHVAGLVALIHEKFQGIKTLQVIGRILASAQQMEIRDEGMQILGNVTLIDCNEALSL